MHLFHGNEYHVQVAYRERTTTYGFGMQIVLLGALQARFNSVTKQFFFDWKFRFSKFDLAN